MSKNRFKMYNDNEESDQEEIKIVIVDDGAFDINPGMYGTSQVVRKYSSDEDIVLDKDKLECTDNEIEMIEEYETLDDDMQEESVDACTEEIIVEKEIDDSLNKFDLFIESISLATNEHLQTLKHDVVRRLANLMKKLECKEESNQEQHCNPDKYLQELEQLHSEKEKLLTKNEELIKGMDKSSLLLTSMNNKILSLSKKLTEKDAELSNCKTRIRELEQTHTKSEPKTLKTSNKPLILGRKKNVDSIDMSTTECTKSKDVSSAIPNKRISSRRVSNNQEKENIKKVTSKQESKTNVTTRKNQKKPVIGADSKKKNDEEFRVYMIKSEDPESNSERQILVECYGLEEENRHPVLVQTKQGNDSDYDDRDDDDGGDASDGYEDILQQAAADIIESSEDESSSKRKKVKRTSTTKVSNNNIDKEEESLTYTCNICAKMLKSRRTLENHLRLVHKVLFECKDCSARFSKKSDLATHIKKEHSRGTFDECKICGELLKNHRNLRLHMKSKHGKVLPVKFPTKGACSSKKHRDSDASGKYECDLCKARLSTKRNLRIHLSILHEEKEQFDCAECEKNFKTKSDLYDHSSEHHPKLTYKCDKCKRTLRGAYAYDLHRASQHPIVKYYDCKRCEKEFDTKCHLKEHMMLAHLVSSRPYQCDDCGNRFTERTNLRVHVQTVHQGIRQYQCDECGKKFYRNSRLVRHINCVHKGLKTASCPICNKQFGDKSYIKQHMDGVHQDSKDFMCELCGKKFGKRGGLQMHVICVHQGIKAYECKYCPKKFSNSSDLSRHTKNVHEGIKRFTCEVCGKRFSQKVNYRRHFDIVHQNIRAFPCEYCQKPFGRKEDLLQHVSSIHHGLKAYECRVCQKAFGSRPAMIKHRHVHHEPDYQTPNQRLKMEAQEQAAAEDADNNTIVDAQ